MTPEQLTTSITSTSARAAIDDELTDPSAPSQSQSSRAEKRRAKKPSGRQKQGSKTWIWVIAGGAALLLFFLTRGSGTGSGASLQNAERAVAVRAAAVTRGDLEIRGSYPGELVGEVSDIASKVSGVLESVPVRLGDHVRRGQVLAIVDDVELASQQREAQSQVNVAEANLERSRAELESAVADERRAAGLFREELLSDQEFERVSAQLATARANVAASEAQVAQAQARLSLLQQQLDDTRVLAPFEGTVAMRYLDRGALVQPGTPVLRVVEQAPLMVQFRVPERDLGIISAGVTFEVTTKASGDGTFDGVVERISGEVTRSDRTALVEGALTETSPLLRPGMYADVQVALRELDDVQLVPGTAVLDRVDASGRQSFGVLVSEAAGESSGENETETTVARWMEVELLGASGEISAIRSSLDDGQLVLTLGHAELLDGTPIRVVQTERTLSSSGRSDGSAGATGATR